MKYALAEFYVSVEKIDEAETLLQKMIEKTPDEINPKLALIKLQTRFRTLEQADKTLERFVTEQPDQYKLQFLLAELRQGKPERARVLYNNIIEQDGTGNHGLEARVRLAQMAIKAKDKDQALLFAEQVLTEDNKNKQALLIRAALFLDAQKNRSCDY